MKTLTLGDLCGLLFAADCPVLLIRGEEAREDFWQNHLQQNHGERCSLKIIAISLPPLRVSLTSCLLSMILPTLSLVAALPRQDFFVLLPLPVVVAVLPSAVWRSCLSGLVNSRPLALISGCEPDRKSKSGD